MPKPDVLDPPTIVYNDWEICVSDKKYANAPFIIA